MYLRKIVCVCVCVHTIMDVESDFEVNCKKVFTMKMRCILLFTFMLLTVLECFIIIGQEIVKQLDQDASMFDLLNVLTTIVNIPSYNSSNHPSRVFKEITVR